MQHQLGRLAKNAIIYGVGQGLNNFIGFLLLPLFTAYLTPADYGVISILGVIAMVTTPIFSLGLGTATGVCYFEGNSRKRKEATIWTVFGILVVSTTILGIGGVTFASMISSLAFQTPRYSYPVAISMLSTCLTILSTPFMLYLQFEERAKTYVAITALSTLASVGLSLIMVVVLRRGVQGMVEGWLLGHITTLVLFLIVTVRRIQFNFNVSLCKELLRLGIPLIPAFAALFILQQSTKWTLQWFWGLDDVGIYSIGFNFGLIMSLCVNGFVNAWIPCFMSFSERKDEAKLLFGHVMSYYILGFGSLSLLFYLAARPVVLIMTQPTFYAAYKVIGLSASAQLLTGVFSILLPGMYFAKDVKYQSLVQLVAASASIGLNLLLVSHLGLFGAALSLMLGYLFMVILQYFWNIKRNYIEIKYEWRRIFSFVLLNVFVAFITLQKRNISLGYEVILSFLVFMLAISLIYILMNDEERQFCRNILKKMLIRYQKRVSIKL